MRLQLTARSMLFAALAMTGCRRAGRPSAQRAEVALHAGYYADNDHVTVWNPSIRARVPITERVTASAGYGMDIISAASVDVVASASRVLERRHEGTIGASVAVDSRNVVQGTFRDSRESDYISDGLALSLDHESPQRDRTVHVELRGRRDLVGPGWVLQHPAPLVEVAASTSVTFVIDRLTVLRLAASTELLEGLQSSVYRYVRIGAASYPERVPDERFRGGLLARLQYSVLRNVALYGEFAAGGDTWDVWSATCDAGMRWQITPWLLADARTRFGVQSAASFYSGSYDHLTTYRTRDRLLGGLTSWWPRASVQIRLPGWPSPYDWEIGAAASYLTQHFADFAPLTFRDAVLLELWLTHRF